MIIRQAGPDDLDAVSVLFDLYRQFYGQAADLAGARRFVGERMTRKESTILCAELEGTLVGFTQLFPCFTSVGMAPILILNDLFVAAGARRQGLARALLEAAVRLGSERGMVRLVLETGTDNTAAQALYERLGWQRDAGTLHYHITT